MTTLPPPPTWLCSNGSTMKSGEGQESLTLHESISVDERLGGGGGLQRQQRIGGSTSQLGHGLRSGGLQETISARESVTVDGSGKVGGGGDLRACASAGGALGNRTKYAVGGMGETIIVRPSVTNEGHTEQRQVLTRGRTLGTSSKGGQGLHPSPRGSQLNEHRTCRSVDDKNKTVTMKEVVHIDRNGRPLASGTSSAAALDTQAIIRDAATRASQGFAAARENVVHVKETHRLRPRESPRGRVTVTESEKVQALRNELEVVTASLEQQPQSGMESIRQELETVKADLERPKRSRSVPMTPRVYYLQPTSPMVPIQPAVLAPPLAAPVPADNTRELQVERLRQELVSSQASAENDRMRLQLQELDRIRVELQMARDADKSAFDLQQRRLEEDNELLRIEVQTVRDSEQRTRVELQRDASDVERLQQEVQLQREEARRNSSKFQMAERRIIELTTAEREGSVTLQDLRKQLQIVTLERDTAQSDILHLKKANSQREAESRTLRHSFQEEGNAISLLKAENETLKAEIQMLNARLKLDADEQRNRQIQNAPRISVDLTTDRQSNANRQEVIEETITVGGEGGGRRTSSTRLARQGNERIARADGGSFSKASKRYSGGNANASSGYSGGAASQRVVTKTVVEIEESSSSSATDD